MLPCPHESCDMPPQSVLLAHVCLLNSVLERGGDRHAGRHGLTMAQWFALGCVGHAGKTGVTHSELGQRLMLSKAPITGVVDRLAKAGFVVREVDAIDRRVSRVKITAQGSAIWETVRGELRGLAMEVCEGVGERDLEMMHKVLTKLLENALRADAPGEKVQVKK